jgi:hypothetical protein
MLAERVITPPIVTVVEEATTESEVEGAAVEEILPAFNEDPGIARAPLPHPKRDKAHTAKRTPKTDEVVEDRFS